MSEPGGAEIVDEVVGNVTGVAEEEPGDQRPLRFRHRAVPGEHPGTQHVRDDASAGTQVPENAVRSWAENAPTACRQRNRDSYGSSGRK